MFVLRGPEMHAVLCLLRGLRLRDDESAERYMRVDPVIYDGLTRVVLELDKDGRVTRRRRRYRVLTPEGRRFVSGICLWVVAFVAALYWL